MWLELTNACNLSCTHCYAVAGTNDTNGLSLGQRKEILAEGARLGARRVQFTGGEPTLCPGLMELIEHARSCQYKDIEVFTNATRLEDRLLRRWATLGVKVASSFYSYDPDTHDSITRSPGSFDQTVQGIKALLTHQIPVRVGVILTRENLSHRRGTIEFLMGLGLKAQEIEYDLVRPTGRGVAEAALLDKGVAETALSELPRLPEDGRAACNEGLAQGTCWKGKITISSEGVAYPCIFARQLPLGKFPEMRLEEIIQGPTVQRLWQMTLEEVETCRDCELRYGCFDCRALAQTATGDLLSKNPRCQYNPYTGLVEGYGGKGMEERPKTRIDLINETVEEEVVIYDPKNHNLHHLNPMAGVIWELCDGNHTPEEITEEVVSVLETDPVQVERDVTKTIEEFQRKGLLEVV
ncbi:MAG TPA: PqqD family peptide modification chaperone, partial [Candidatus Tripitaka sp. YC43]